MNELQQFVVTLGEETTAAEPWPFPVRQAGDDFFARVERTPGTTGSFVMTSFQPTSYIASQIQRQFVEHARDLSALRSVIYWQHRLIDYGSVYQAFLLGQMSEDEFSHEADAFVIEPNHHSANELVDSITRINRLVDVPFSMSDYADMFSVDYADIASIVSSINAGGQGSVRIKEEHDDSDGSL